MSEMRSTPCGLEGQQAQARACTPSHGWEEWSDVGTCVEKRECVTGMVRSAEDGSCGYCGTFPRLERCTKDGLWGEPEMSGECMLQPCPAYPGDERPGFIDCGGTACGPTMNCCGSLSSGTCDPKECVAGTKSGCDGPEDCEALYCVVALTGSGQKRGICSADAAAERWCHTDADCDEPTPYCYDHRYKLAGKNTGWCAAEAPP
jgi:hypothetical protein